jgi:hypothetical protein
MTARGADPDAGELRSIHCQAKASLGFMAAIARCIRLVQQPLAGRRTSCHSSRSSVFLAFRACAERNATSVSPYE